MEWRKLFSNFSGKCFYRLVFYKYFIYEFFLFQSSSDFRFSIPSTEEGGAVWVAGNREKTLFAVLSPGSLFIFQANVSFDPIYKSYTTSTFSSPKSFYVHSPEMKMKSRNVGNSRNVCGDTIPELYVYWRRNILFTFMGLIFLRILSPLTSMTERLMIATTGNLRKLIY